MRDTKPCHHKLSDGAVYKEVVVIGNGPSGIVTSFMLAGNVPYLRAIPPELPLDEMLRARLQALPPLQSLYEADLLQLAEGLEGRSQNPLPLLMDSLLNPCADLGIQAEPLIEWKYDVEKQIEHVVLGKGPAGGSWHSFDGAVRTLSPSGWLALPPHAALPGHPRADRVPAADVARYYQLYVHTCPLKRFFHEGVVVTSVSVREQSAGHAHCHSALCPLNAAFTVTGYESASGRRVTYVCARVVVAGGANDRPNALPGCHSRHALTSPPALRDALHTLHALHDQPRPQHDVDGVGSGATVLVVGSGVSAADAVLAARECGCRVVHAYRAPPPALAALSRPLYPDYAQVYEMMQAGVSGDFENYIPLLDYVVTEVEPLPDKKTGTKSEPDYLTPKRIKLKNFHNNDEKEFIVSIFAVLIGSKPDLHFLSSNLNLTYVNYPEYERFIENKSNDKLCLKCSYNRMVDENNKKNAKLNFLKHWYTIKNVLEQGIQSCRSRYWDYQSEINGNTNKNCNLPVCKNFNTDKIALNDSLLEYNLDDRHHFKSVLLENKNNVIIHELNSTKDKTAASSIGRLENRIDTQNLQIVDTRNISKSGKACECTPLNPYSSGLGFGIDPTKPIDCRSNPIAIDKSSHEILNAPKGMYALGPLTGDNFVRFVSGGALAIVSHIWREKKNIIQV